MEYDLEYSELLDGYNENDYIYIVDSCMNVYATTERPELRICETCGDTEWIIEEGYLKDLKEHKKMKRKIKSNNKLIDYK